MPEFTKMVSSVFPCHKCLKKEMNQRLTHYDLIWGLGYMEYSYLCDTCFLCLRLEGSI